MPSGGDDNRSRSVTRVARVPNLEQGDPDDGHEDDHDADDVTFAPPLPPEDRLWRHPSEMGSDHGLAQGHPVAVASAPRRWPDRRTAALMLVSGAVGATLTVGAVALGVLGGERVVERQVAVRTPVIDEGPAGVRAVADRTGSAVVGLVVRRGAESTRASAVVLRSDGYLITDGPSVADADEIEVVSGRGRPVRARLVGTDDVTGIAVVHLDAELEGAVLADDDHALAVGARTLALGGWPDDDGGRMASVGFVSAVGRRLRSGDATRHGMILVDAPFPAGLAGGALVDGAGAVVGIVGGASAAGDGMRFGVATPIDLARHVAEQLVAHGRASHVRLGLHGTDLDPDAALALGLAGGAHVEDVEEDGPAGRSGIAAGDIVVAVDGEPTPTMSALIVALRRHLPGDVVELSVHRDGEVRSVRVTLAARA